MTYFARRWGIRAQLLVLVAGALLPLTAFVAWTLYQQHVSSRAHLRGEARERAEQLRDAVDSHLHFSEGVLASLAPLALRSGGVLQRADLESVIAHLPPYATNVMAFDAKGRLLSSHLPPTPNLAAGGMGERAVFGAAIKSPDIAMTDMIVGKLTGKRFLNSALAYRDAAGEIAGVLVLTTDVAIFESRVLDPSGEHRATVGIVTLDGKAVMSSTGPIAIDPTQPPLGAEALRRGDFDGELEVGGARPAFAAVRALRAPWVVIVAGGDDFEQGAATRLSAMLAAAFAALVLGLAAAVWISRRITGPFMALRNAAEVLGDGDLRHRVPELPGEAGRVGRAFNAMAEQLEVQRGTIRADAERFRAVFDHCPLPMGISDMQTGCIVEVNAAFTEATGIPADDVIGKSSGQIGLWAEPEQRTTALRLIEQQGRIASFECRHRARGGKIADVLFFADAMEIGGRRMLLSQAVDVTERKRGERQLHEVSKRLLLATRSARMGIWDLDLQGEALVWDDTMFDLHGVAPREFGARFEDWLRRVHHEDRHVVEKCRAQALAGRAEVDIQYRVVRPDGAVRHVRSSASLERDECGAAVRLMGTCFDVTENVVGRERLARVNSELEARVVERTGELQETVRELEAFSYTVAHDLRAPLRAIDGFSCYLGQTLRDSQAGEVPALLSKIRRNVGSMDRLIDGLLNYARLGRQDVRGVPVDMTGLARNVSQLLAETYPQVDIEVDALPDTFGDPHMLQQVWTNLIGNACKFAAVQPTPRVAVGCAADASGAVYFVRDNGVGFDMRYSHRLFRVFERLHTDPELGGTGVGLAVVQRVLQRHAGAVWAEGSPGEGATFYFRLPHRSASPR